MNKATDEAILKARVARVKESSRSRQKKKYQLAKDAGFTSQEAVVLQNWSEDRIKRLAESRDRASK